MKNKYIKNKGFSVKYNLKSLLICYDYFNHGVKLPKYVDYLFARKAIHKIMRLMIIIAYIFKIYNLRYKIVTLNENAHVIYKGKGEWYNVVRLIQENSKLKIVKTTFDKESYLREKRYYQIYKNGSLNIKLPKMYFKKNNQIEIEFLKTKSFQRCINDGSMNFEEAYMHFNKIEKQMHLFYKEKFTIIHSDLSTENILVNGNDYYLIDYADSRIGNIEYDLFVLLRSILFSFNHHKVNKNLVNYALNNDNLSKLLNLNKERTIQFENIFRTLDLKKHPKHKVLIKKQNLHGSTNFSLLTVN